MHTGVLCFDDSWITDYLFGLFRRRSWLGWSVRQSWKVGFMLTRRRSSCLSFAFVGKFSCLIIMLHESLWRSPGSYFWNLELTVSMPCTQRQERYCSSCVWDRYYNLHETHPLWYYKMISGYGSFYLCFCLGQEGKYILLKAKAGSDYMLIVLGIFSKCTLVFKLFKFKLLES